MGLHLSSSRPSFSLVPESLPCSSSLSCRIWGAFPGHYSWSCRRNSISEELPSSQLCVLLSVSMHCSQGEKVEAFLDPCDVLLNVSRADTQCGMHPTMGPCFTELGSNSLRLCVYMCENIHLIGG